MSTFFDKLKQGASDTAKKAQQAVEVTKLKSQISSKEREIENHFKHLGESVFKAFTENDLSKAELSIRSRSEQIMELQKEMLDLQLKITEVKNEKKCVCGKTVLLDFKFCQSCGHRFD
ncbi:MAG TPA: hypothetical protein VGE40_04005 [Bacilli bacterium]